MILCHATEGIYKLNIESVTSMSIMSKFTAFTGFTLGRTGVPVFLMISGYLLLDREYDKTRTIRFWKITGSSFCYVQKFGFLYMSYF